MRYRLALICALSIFVIGNVPAATSSGPAINQIPAEFHGRWVSSPDQCEAPEKGWLYVESIRMDFPEGYATVNSVRQIDVLEIEVDLTWRVRSNDGKDWRQIRRFALSQDRRTLIDQRDGDRVVRVRCE
jgi:hypothetical protein